MLESSQDFSLILRVNIADTVFDYSFYDLFLPNKNDNRLVFLVKAVGRWGGDFNLPVLEKGIPSEQLLTRHKEHLRKLGLKVSGDEIRGVQSGACYAGRENTFVIRADGRVCKCTVAFEDDFNDIGYLDIEKEKMVIDYNKEDLWSYAPLSHSCHTCKKMVTCCNRSCPLNRLKNRNGRCC